MLITTCGSLGIEYFRGILWCEHDHRFRTRGRCSGNSGLATVNRDEFWLQTERSGRGFTSWTKNIVAASHIQSDWRQAITVRDVRRAGPGIDALARPALSQLAGPHWARAEPYTGFTTLQPLTARRGPPVCRPSFSVLRRRRPSSWPQIARTFVVSHGFARRSQP